MAEGRRYGLAPQLDQILMEAQHRWLRPAEICEILKNYKKFRIAPEPPNRPQSGSLFLFDRKVLRYFRKDGHNWRKKKDGKTIKEAHERLKAGSVDVLHCYYAHGEDNECFQRRSYWMLEEHLMHIVLVHYLEVKGGRSNLHRIREVEHSNNADSPLCSTSFTSQSQNNLPSQNTEAESSISGQTSEYEDAESVLQFNASVSKAKFESADNLSSGGTGYHSFPQMQREYTNGPGSIINPSLLNPFAISTTDNLHLGGDFRDMAAPVPFSELYMPQEDLAKAFGEPGVDTSFNGQAAHFDLSAWDDVVNHSTVTTAMQTPSSIDMSFTSTQQIPFGEDDIEFDNLVFDGAYASEFDLKEGDIPSVDLKSQWEILPDNYELQERPIDGKADSPLFPPLEKGDSFNRWMSNELEEVDSNVKSNSHTLWNTVEAEAVLANTGGSSHGHLDTYMVGPMISQDQLFSIVDYSPSWAYVSVTTKVLVMGTFLKSNEEVNRCKWSCMFGEIEVPADILSDGTLRCYAPTHKPGRVPFYVTCSNRLACSEVREFEFRAMDSQSMDISDHNNRITDEMYLSMRLEKLITLGPNAQQISIVSPTKEKQELSNKITLLMSESDEWSNLLKLTDEGGLGFLDENPKDELVERLMKEKLHLWLLHKVNEEGKGPCVLDKEGQGVIHLTAALGYDWAIRPTITAGVNINFRDAHGWTALHWAAFCGREKTVVALIALGAAPGLLTDPTPEFSSGSTPADLASSNNHKGISGFLAESSLTSLLEILTLKDSKCADLALMHTIQTGAVDVNIPTDDGSLKDSLSAVRNAAITRARIYQVFRMQSFQRKQLKEFDDDVSGISGERAIAIASAKAMKASPGDKVHLAATRIQNKFRGYKGRKEFLLIKQRIVKIQAHVRGHQVRKHYRKIVWSVGIVEKIILRWRRRGSGLRGFRSDGPSLEGPSNIQTKPAKEDDDDFLREGRRQTEVRLEKALARVKSMVQYPEARDQYSRLLTVVTKLQESQRFVNCQAIQETTLKESEEADEVGDFMVEFRELWEDDTPVPGFN
ncbi:calmodulin-binding transcription activator 3-like isoform X5 [Carex rostrata]